VNTQHLPVGYTSRPATMEDAEPAVTLFNACSNELVGETPHDADEQRVEWRTPRFELDRDTRVVCAPDGALVGYAEVWDTDEPHVRIYSWGRVHPQHRGRGIGSALLAWEEERARKAIAKAPEGARVSLHHGALKLDEKAQSLLEGRGFDPVRSFRRMVIEMEKAPPTPAWPEGVRVRSLDPASDLEGMVRSVRATFVDHWGHVDSPFEDELEQWRHWVSEEKDFDPSIWFLATADEAIVGTCLCWPKRNEDPEMGWINVLGVDRRWRRRGLGLALLHHAFGAFHRRGKRRVGLGVDGASLTGATGLYEKAGMRVVRESIAYEKELRPGKDLSRQSLDEEGGNDDEGLA